MCGIAALLRLDGRPVDPAVLARMSDSLIHRGPDGGGVHLEGPVALIPDKAPGRLSGQERRSRYESVLALYHLVTETPGLSPVHAHLAYRRALSRAYRFQRRHGGHWLLTGHLLRLWRSRVGDTVDVAAMYRALGAFTEDGSTERPAAWLPGALGGPA